MHQGRHFLQIPGPSPVPDRILRAMDMPVIDHRSAEFAALGRTVLEGSAKIFQTKGPVVIFPSSAGLSGETILVVSASAETRLGCDFWSLSTRRDPFCSAPRPSARVQAVERDHRGLKCAQRRLVCVAPKLSPDSPASSGTGAWEAAIVNTLSPGDKVLMVETGHFATLWRQLAGRFGIEVDFIAGDWRHGADPARIEARLAADTAHSIKAVMVVHNETSTGATSRIADIRAAIDRTAHPALLMVDTISSLGSVDHRHDEWKVDVSVSCSQKGFMLPPGLGFNAISEKARAASRSNRMPRSYFDWEEMLKPNANGFFPYTPATNLLYGLREAIAMLLEEGLDNVFARHQRLAAATRAAVNHWGLEVLCQEPAEFSPVLTAVLMPPGHDADQFRKVVLDNFNMSLGSGLSKVAGKVFRIGHLGECNELTLLGALTGVEMGLSVAGVPHRAGGVAVAMKLLEQRDQRNASSHLKVVGT